MEQYSSKRYTKLLLKEINRRYIMLENIMNILKKLMNVLVKR